MQWLAGVLACWSAQEKNPRIPGLQETKDNTTTNLTISRSWGGDGRRYCAAGSERLCSRANVEGR